MKNIEVARRFAMGFKGTAKHLFSEGDCIYSYGYHRPITYKMKKNKVLFNSTFYGYSTAYHKALVREALEANGWKIILATKEEIEEM